jgi:nitrate reductase delta subunit
MLAPSNRADVASQVKRWTRERFGDVTVLVSEVESITPGFPALHTVVAFWTAEHKHYHFRIFKPLLEVVEEDLPPSWYKEALAVAFVEGMQCECC